MAYMCEISPNQRVYLDCHGSNTVVTMITGGPGQQQQASNSFQTGVWVSPPTMFAVPFGAVIKINTAQGDYYIQLQGSSMTLTNAAAISSSQPMPMHPMATPAAPTMEPMPPMTPLPPMTMGNMQMNNNPMEMRMGNMQMRMGEPLPPAQAAQVTRKFCSQCGAAVEASDRFCASCGHRLV